MLTIISPSKAMDMGLMTRNLPSHKPEFNKDAEYIASVMARYSKEELMHILNVGSEIAALNYNRYRSFHSRQTPRKQALFAYTGTVFRHIRPQDLTDEQLAFADDHLRIISTLYGPVKPLDTIKAYRLAFKIHMPDNDETLYSYWKDKITKSIDRDVSKTGGVLLNLASGEISKSVDIRNARGLKKVVTPHFQEYRNGKYETIRSYVKMARGEMVNYIISNRIDDPERIKGFSWAGYEFDESLSDVTNYYFNR